MYGLTHHTHTHTLFVINRWNPFLLTVTCPLNTARVIIWGITDETKATFEAKSQPFDLLCRRVSKTFARSVDAFLCTAVHPLSYVVAYC